MTILTALATLYERMKEAGEAPPRSYSNEKIGAEVVLDAAGKVLDIRRQGSADGKKWVPKTLAVPAPPSDRRGRKVVPGFLWDPTAYSLGVSLDQSGSVSLEADNAAAKFEAFRDFHLKRLRNTNDPGLVALRIFLRAWKPAHFVEHDYPVEIVKSNAVFRLDGDTGADGAARFIHDRQAAVDLLNASESEAHNALCLVTGQYAPVARLHPSFVGLGKDAQSSGAYLVSFNIGSKKIVGASSSYGKEQGDNAPVSEKAAFAYGTALKSLLARDSGHNLRIGDATVVFWAETPQRAEAQSIEQMLFGGFNPPDDDAESSELRVALEAVAKGRAAQAPGFDPDTKVYFLGLAPNVARLSVRFWQPGTFGDFARHITRFWNDLALDPSPWKTVPAAWSLLYETAIRIAGKPNANTIPPRLGGDLMHAVLTGTPYPRTLLSSVINRMRADGDINGRRAAICRAIINRNTNREEIPMSLDRDNPNPAYCLGRLFAAYTYAEHSHSKRSATIRDKYLAGASASPARIFPLLMRGYEHNRSALLKATDKRKGYGVKVDKEVSTIVDLLDGAADLPSTLTMDDQGRFFVGFYHQWNSFFEKPEDAAEASVTGIVEDDQ